MFLHVAVQAGFLHKGSFAQFALVGFDPRVQSLVGPHVVGGGESSAALLTLEGAVPTMCLDVAAQSQLGVERLGAEVAVELPLSLMY